ncbi:S-layer homology domain-containing protein [Cytobacillus suaedae]|nr:S-layer homology domain-containing protein [Cytobacillus suaedae]
MGKYVIKALFITSLFTLIFVFNTTQSLASTSFTDIEGSYAKDAIQELVEKGILSGSENGQFDPTGKINRQDFAIILAKSIQLDTTTVPAQATFSDVPPNHYSYAYVEAAVKAALIDGIGEDKFGLDTHVTRENMATLFVKALGVDSTGYGDKLTFADKGQISSWAKDAVAYAVEAGLMKGDDNNLFNPHQLAERQQVALVALNFIVKAESLGVIPPTVPPVVEEPPVEQPVPEEPPVEQFPVVTLPLPIVETVGQIVGGSSGSNGDSFSVDIEGQDTKIIYYRQPGVDHKLYLNNGAVDYNTFSLFLQRSLLAMVTVQQSEEDNIKYVNVINNELNQCATSTENEEEPQAIETQAIETQSVELHSEEEPQAEM